MEIKTEDYSIYHQPETATVFMGGMLRLEGIDQYQSILDLLLNAAQQTSAFTLNLRELEFINSSGISMLSMFAIQMRQKGSIQVTLLGSSKILWQTKSLRNLQRLMPSLKLEYS